MRCNYYGPVYLVYAALKWLSCPCVHGYSGSRIIAVTSQAALARAPYRAGYVASKAALQTFLEALECEESGRIPITITYPPFVSTGIRTASKTFGVVDNVSAPAPSSAPASATERSFMTPEMCADITVRAGDAGYYNEYYDWMGVLLGVFNVHALLRPIVNYIALLKFAKMQETLGH